MDDEGCLDRDDTTLRHALILSKMEQLVVPVEDGSIDFATRRHDQLKRRIDSSKRLLLRRVLGHFVEVCFGHIGRIGDHQFAPILHGKSGHARLANSHHGLAVNKVDPRLGIFSHIKGCRTQLFKLRPILPNVGVGLLCKNLAAHKGQQGKDKNQSFH